MRTSPRLLAAIFLLATAAGAQPPAGTVPAEQPPRPRGLDEAPPSKMEPVEVTEKRDTTAQRRDATAAKIVIGREEIEQYGDTNLGDVMRRLPGVTQSGRPGRRGAVRMRGMAGGYTQILVNGERIPPGFSIEDITSDQVERIEILRAPTAETGTRAVAGTINIVLREALRQRLNDVRAGTQVENGRPASNVSVTRNATIGEAGSYNVTISANRRNESNDGVVDTTYVDIPTGAVTLAQRSLQDSVAHADSLFMTSRLQWRLGPGEQFTFQPFLVARDNDSGARGSLAQSVGSSPAPYDSSATNSRSRFRAARFMTTYNGRLAAQTTVELRGGAGTFTVEGDSALDQFDATGLRTLRQTSVTDITDRSWNATLKLAQELGEAHKATAGAEWERSRRREAPVTILNDVPQLADFGAEFAMSVRRAAAYVQHEWDPSPQWASSLGLRWEAIETRSDVAGTPAVNRSSILSPLAHVVWRFDAPRRDQLRASLTQSYRPPTTQNLVARPSLNTLHPVPGPNTATSADVAGSPALKPEVANGFEIAYERYLPASGVVSVNVFTRRLTDVIRNVTALETVSWATSPRWVKRAQNLGRAASSGIEFDAKLRVNELMAGAPPVNVRANLSLFRSRVDGIPAPDNRLASQPDMTANLGADYRFRGTPLAVGGSVNWTPAYDTRVAAEEIDRQRRKVVGDVYALWNFDGETRLRLSVSKSAPRDFQTATIFQAGDEQQSVVDTRRGYLVTALRLEMRL